MDFGALGVDISILAAIVGISEIIKNRIDIKNKFKKFYFLLPILISLVAALFAAEEFSLQAYGKNVFVYAGISAYGYDTLKGIFKKK